MTALDALGCFLTVRYPFWGVCAIRFVPQERLLYIRCETLESRASVIKDRFELAALDIGLQRIVVSHSHYDDFMIALSA